MEDDSLSQLHRDWSIAIGSAILGFGDIEWVTHEYLVRFSSDNIGGFTSKLQFANRVSLIKELMSGKEGVNDLVEELNDKLNEAVELSGIRNAIVHNPLQVSIYSDEEGNINLRDEVISYRKKSKVYVLHDVLMFSENSWRLARELRSLYSQLDKKLFP